MLDSITIPNGGYTSTYTNPVTITGGAGASSVFTINTGAGIGASGTITIGGSEWLYKGQEEWVNCFPDWARIEKMCEQYPGLKIAFEKFKTTYKLVKDHYDTPEDQRPRP